MVGECLLINPFLIKRFAYWPSAKTYRWYQIDHTHVIPLFGKYFDNAVQMARRLGHELSLSLTKTLLVLCITNLGYELDSE
ncbi:hypothetical protein MAR_032502 [Mya arenaria]|uniref:Uncharacterized protein n=1 Tax=Mya arenaria TaxID=6604 RepID=A0ABY7F6U3_MYAAR|nr:hypothetical protein MAR_032502 [Mya arenaria]